MFPFVNTSCNSLDCPKHEFNNTLKYTCNSVGEIFNGLKIDFAIFKLIS